MNTKAFLIGAAYQAAAELVDAYFAPPNPSVPVETVDQMKADQALQLKNLAVYETAKVHYAAMVMALADKTGVWPDPPADGSLIPGNPPGVVAAQGDATAILKAIAGSLPAGSPAINALTQAIQAIAGLSLPIPVPGHDIGVTAK